MSRLRILPLFVLVIAVLLLAMGFMIVKTYEDGGATRALPASPQPAIPSPTPAVIPIQTTSTQPPVSHLITINPIDDHYLGEIVTITGTTTCTTGDIRTVIYNDNWHPCQKTSGGCADNPDPCCDGVRINAPILPGENGNNTWSVEVNTSQHNLYPGTFFVEVTAPGCPMDEESYQEFYTYMNIRDVNAQPSVPRWWIRIDPISDKQAGEDFTITSTTNLSAGEEIIVYVNLAPQPALQNFSGCTGGVTVNPGRNGTNTISFPVRPSVCQNLIPAEYSISEFDMFNRASDKASFNIIPRTAQTTPVPPATPDGISGKK